MVFWRSLVFTEVSQVKVDGEQALARKMVLLLVLGCDLAVLVLVGIDRQSAARGLGGAVFSNEEYTVSCRALKNG